MAPCYSPPHPYLHSSPRDTRVQHVLHPVTQLAWSPLWPLNKGNRQGQTQLSFLSFFPVQSRSTEPCPPRQICQYIFFDIRTCPIPAPAVLEIPFFLDPGCPIDTQTGAEVDLFWNADISQFLHNRLWNLLFPEILCDPYPYTQTCEFIVFRNLVPNFHQNRFVNSIISGHRFCNPRFPAIRTDPISNPSDFQTIIFLNSGPFTFWLRQTLESTSFCASDLSCFNPNRLGCSGSRNPGMFHFHTNRFWISTIMKSGVSDFHPKRRANPNCLDIRKVLFLGEQTRNLIFVGIRKCPFSLTTDFQIDHFQNADTKICPHQSFWNLSVSAVWFVPIPVKYLTGPQSCVSRYWSCLRVQFLLKTDSGYPKDTGVTWFTMATPGNPLRYDTPRSALPVSALAHSRGPRKRSQSPVSRTQT